ncbi:endonuclease/exonuclease/phosphatase family protein [Chryseobacterium gotjawalense]|uniref:Endonuclease/exonuclease/phosphatase family protein n=1 Tax=Chryseobacterium gotjawalense TaxID=3042315 RepID=A0ABY8R9V2_9FLAO|nr:endonuclease/exonuclease/phosphatase family protein [Chryseobacterium sp. wdc7]WHF50732.1 endonuclease/exonuclease/phosphatase family protein [Chryseobacterium sp. wdc7]
MKILRFGLILIHLFIIVLLGGTVLNGYVSPKVFPYLNLLSLAFPVLMILNIILCVFWIFLWKKRALFFIAITLMIIMPIRRWVNWTEKVAEKPNLKIVTLNIKGGAIGGHKKIGEYLEKTNADIIFGQEYGSEFNVPNYPYQSDKYEIVALNSKTEIVKQGKIATTGNGNAFFADIKFNGKIIRVINVYLNPFSFDKQMVKPVEDLQKNKTKIKDIIKKLVPTFKIHQKEIVDIRKAIDDSPYPVILAGDFNSVPNSYEYYELGRGLKDAFAEVGRGSSTSFHDYKFPIRIDYIFTSKEIKPISYHVDRSVKLSDHFPVIAEFKID